MGCINLVPREKQLYVEYFYAILLNQDSFNFNLTLTRDYKTIPRKDFPPNQQILKLDPVLFHAPIHLLSLFFQTLEPPIIQLRGASRFSFSALS